MAENPLKGCFESSMEWYWYHNPVTGCDEHRNTFDTYMDEEKCKLCKHSFELRCNHGEDDDS